MGKIAPSRHRNMHALRPHPRQSDFREQFYKEYDIIHEKKVNRDPIPFEILK